MANNHWSNFSHKPKFFFVSAIPFILTMPLILLGQLSSVFFWILGFLWVYVIIFEKLLKMPMQYSFALFRTWLTGKNKRVSHPQDKFYL